MLSGNARLAEEVGKLRRLLSDVEDRFECRTVENAALRAELEAVTAMNSKCEVTDANNAASKAENAATTACLAQFHESPANRSARQREQI